MHLAASLFLASFALSSAAQAAGARVLIVPWAGDDAATVEQGLRSGSVGIPGAEVADAATTAALIEGAKSTGLDCATAPDDEAGCWLRVALLGGLDTVVFANAFGVTRASAEGSSTSPALTAGEAGWAAAVRRVFGRESALRITLTPPTAIATLDGTPTAQGVIEGLVSGSHVVAATAEGYQPISTTVGVAPGALAEVNLLMVAVEPEASGLPGTLLWGGGGTLAVGVAAGVGLATVGWFAAGCKFDKTVCGPVGSPTKALADGFSVAGLSVGVGLGAIGAAAIAGSFVVQ